MQKADVAEHPEVSNHVGLLINEPPGIPGCSLFSHPTTSSIFPCQQSASYLTAALPTTSSYSIVQGKQ
jgi:hypothetical protein